MFTTAAAVITEGNLTGLNESVITPHLKKGEIDLKKLVPVATLTLVGGESAPYDATDKEVVTAAESLLVLAHALPKLVNLAGKDGGITRTQGLGDSQTVFVSHREAVSMAKDYRAQAGRLLKPYMEAMPEGAVSAGGFDLWDV
jgi:hypothetical protein